MRFNQLWNLESEIWNSLLVAADRPRFVKHGPTRSVCSRIECASRSTRASGGSFKGTRLLTMPVMPGRPAAVHAGPGAAANALASGSGSTGRTTVSAHA